MTDDARRPLSEDERARIHAARRDGGMCTACGRPRAEGEAVWMDRVVVRGEYGDVAHWRVPVGAECVSPEFRRETEGKEPEPCVGCGRGVYYQAAPGRQRRALCSRVCGRAGTTPPSSRRRWGARTPTVYAVPTPGDDPPWVR